jgi:hypothetical protein
MMPYKNLQTKAPIANGRIGYEINTSANAMSHLMSCLRYAPFKSNPNDKQAPLELKFQIYNANAHCV